MFTVSKTNESGRSMVEMLGVLAIIGVLSVGGIAGYTAAIRTHKVNEIVNATYMCYMLGMAQNAGTGGQEMMCSSKPDGVTSITFQTTNQIEIVGIADATLCAQVKAKFDNKATDCPNASPFTITVTLGDVMLPGIVPATFDNGYPECPAGYKFVNSPGAECANSLSAATEDCQRYGNYNPEEVRRDLGWGEVDMYNCI
ncbi:MAG: hypothetical protein II938_01295 [Alphaproteobacteria bacterium]|nr:hypothetical protein [Alphaproteobacteria bacterium]